MFNFFVFLLVRVVILILSLVFGIYGFMPWLLELLDMFVSADSSSGVHDITTDSDFKGDLKLREEPFYLSKVFWIGVGVVTLLLCSFLIYSYYPSPTYADAGVQVSPDMVDASVMVLPDVISTSVDATVPVSSVAVDATPVSLSAGVQTDSPGFSDNLDPRIVINYPSNYSVPSQSPDWSDLSNNLSTGVYEYSSGISNSLNPSTPPSITSPTISELGAMVVLPVYPASGAEVIELFGDPSSTDYMYGNSEYNY